MDMTEKLLTGTLSKNETKQNLLQSFSQTSAVSRRVIFSYLLKKQRLVLIDYHMGVPRNSMVWVTDRLDMILLLNWPLNSAYTNKTIFY